MCVKQIRFEENVMLAGPFVKIKFTELRIKAACCAHLTGHRPHGGRCRLKRRACDHLELFPLSSGLKVRERTQKKAEWTESNSKWITFIGAFIQKMNLWL